MKILSNWSSSARKAAFLSKRVTPGMTLRLLCSAAPRAIFANLSAFLASFLPSHLTTDQSDGNAQRFAIPSSVPFCARNSSLSPLGNPAAIVTSTGISTLLSSSLIISKRCSALSTTFAKRLMWSSKTRTTSSSSIRRITLNICFTVSLSVIVTTS